MELECTSYTKLEANISLIFLYLHKMGLVKVFLVTKIFIENIGSVIFYFVTFLVAKNNNF